MSPKPVFLDVDSSIVENNLRIAKDPSEEELNALFPPGEQYPSKLVKPFPGFCIKSKELGTDTKIFVNICQTDAIPPPEDVSEVQLVEICNSSSDEEPGEFRIPMSIGEVRAESDKKGNSAKAVDVAINPQFFRKVENSSLFKNFLMAVVFEGLSNKHNLRATDDRVLLKNRKAYGELQHHRIQQREIDQKMGRIPRDERAVLDELIGKPDDKKSKPIIETLSSVAFDDSTKPPEYRLFKKTGAPGILYGEFKLPNVFNSKDITLDTGEDRIILEAKEQGYFLDVFIPCNVNQNEIQSAFNKKTKILTVTMPLKTT